MTKLAAARVLVLDDEPLIAMMLRNWLEELGHQIVGPANTLESTFALLESVAVDAALLDLSVGGQHSYGVAEALRGRGIPFLFLTGHGCGSIRAPYDDVPALTKPIDFEQMRVAVAGLVNGKV